MSQPCQADSPADCHRSYCVRNNECAERAASAPCPASALLSELRLAREYVWRAFNKDSSTLKGVAQQRAAGHRLDQIDRAIAKATA